MITFVLEISNDDILSYMYPMYIITDNKFEKMDIDSIGPGRIQIMDFNCYYKPIIDFNV